MVVARERFPLALASELRGVLTGLSLVVAALLLAISVDLGIPGQELLQSLRFHFVIVCLLLPIGLALCRAPLRATVMLALLLLSATQGALIIAGQFQRREAPPAVAGTLSLLSFNVLSDNPQPEAVVNYITTQMPQVVVLMEANGLADQFETLRAAFPNIVGCPSKDDCDTAILTTLPVKTSYVHEFGPFRRHRMVTVWVEFQGQKVAIVAAHLSKPYFDRASAAELAELTGSLQWQKIPTILAGDFNSAAWSTSMASMLRDANMAPPPFLPATWPVELGPFGIPIDNIFSSDGVFIREIAALPDPLGSNHFGLTARIDIAE